ncbi:MAG: EamA family transporter [Minwuia sp.]|uniref:EamA family transporter n=1 Tax=Minwuia sp. TaxID=2493630 RepID=UPI003A8B5E11
MNRRDALLAVLAALIWGGTYPFSALALQDTPPMFFTALRFSCAACFILIVPRPRIPVLKLLLLGLFLGAALFALTFIAMTQGLSASLASVLVHVQAFFTILISMVVFGERMNRRQLLALLITGAGITVLAVDRGQAGSAVALLLIMLAALSGGIGNNIMKSLGQTDMFRVSVWMTAVPPLPLFALSYALEGDGTVSGLIDTITWPTIIALAYSSVLATIVVFAIWGRLLVAYSSAAVAPFFLLVPVFAVALSAIILGETLSAMQITGGVLVFAGLALALLPARKPPLPVT